MKKIYILALAALAMAFSCQKNENAPETATEPVIRTFTCKIADAVDPETKLAINEADGETTWEVGDEIFIHGKYFGPSYTKTVTLAAENISADGKTATFDVDLSDVTPNKVPDYECEYFAAYPADAVGGYSSGANMYYYNCFANTNKPLMAGYIEGNTINFYNICGAISFIVDGDFDQVSFKGNGDEDIAYTYYRVKIVPSEKNYKHTRDGASSTITQSIVADGATVNKIYFPNGASFSGGFTMKFLKSGSIVKTLSTDKSVTIARNEYRPMGDVTSYLKTYVPPAEHDSSIDMTGAIALDASDNANCYIVDGTDDDNAGKVFTFKAYMGNSTTGVGTIASAAIVWETYNNAESVTANSVIAEVDFDKQTENDYYTMVFKMPASLHVGNALIAAKDAGDNILWSWHIWVPAAAVSDSDYTSFIGGSMMNMNLGALSAVPATGETTIESLGLLYQWGRKDPFVGAREWKDYPSKARVSGTGWTKSSTQVSIADAIKTPTVYYYTGSDDGDWNLTADGTLWDNSGSKTMYDPCPPGYKVPVNSGALWTKTDDGWNFDTTNHVSVHTASGVRLPMAGFIEAYGGSLYGTGPKSDSTNKEATYIWSATNYDDTKANCVLIRTDKSPKYYKAYRGKANAGSVRCVAE